MKRVDHDHDHDHDPNPDHVHFHVFCVIVVVVVALGVRGREHLAGEWPEERFELYSDEFPHRTVPSSDSVSSSSSLTLPFLFRSRGFPLFRFVSRSDLTFISTSSSPRRFSFRSHIHFNEFESKARAVSSPFNFIPLIRDVAVKTSEARTCNTPSHKFCGICYSSRNCAHVCNTEGYPNGECRGFRSRYFCSRNCWN
ncbi:hypothetical protein VNO78_33487 [Psophocarpus tetragonolobus]|uniref:Knottins-like domain-containing protein n=1 Tax=Psophocarpus tetragonolobus TaxID=3891 RepID=A0AAN9NY46_PSOTE